MRLSEVKRRNRVIGIVAAAILFQAGGLDARLRAAGGPLFSFAVLVLLFFLSPILLEYLERKFTK